MLDQATAFTAPFPTFDAAHADYLAKLAYSDALVADADQCDAATDACCQAMDFLIERVPAPTVAALRIKMLLAHERTDGLDFFADYWTAIMADLDRLSTASAWTQALAAYRHAHDEWGYRISAFSVVEAAYFADRAAGKSDQYHRLEAFADQWRETTSEAQRALLTTPAPDVAAAALKIEIAIEWGSEIFPLVSELRQIGGVA